MKPAGGTLLRHPKDVVVVLRLLVLAGLALLGLGEPPTHRFLFWFTVIVYGVTNLGYLASRKHLFATARTQLWIFLFDACVVSLLVVARGTQVPEFIVAYFTLVLMAAVAQGLGTAVFNSIFVCALYAAVTLWGRPLDAMLTFPILSQFAFFVVIAVFMGHVAALSRDRGEERKRAEAIAARLEVAVAGKTQDLRASLAELETTRSRLEANERLAALGTLSAGIAHEIRNPLAAIMSSLEESPSILAEVEAGLSGSAGRAAVAELRAAMDDGLEACRQLARVATDLTTVARTGPAQPGRVEARDSLECAARLLRHRARHGLAIDVACSTTRGVLADPGRLQQVLLNLGANSLDAMEDRGGTLTFSAEDGPDGRVLLGVADTGIGMPPEVRERAFEAFFTTKGPGKGTGLGLHLVREIVRAHGAHIEFDTEPDGGTKFRILWPAASDAAVPKGADHGSAAWTHSNPPRGRRGDHPSGARPDLAARAV